MDSKIERVELELSAQWCRELRHLAHKRHSSMDKVLRIIIYKALVASCHDFDKQSLVTSEGDTLV